MIKWTEEQWGKDKGYRSEDGGIYVGANTKGFYRIWVRDAGGTFRRAREIFSSAKEAKASIGRAA